MMRRARSPKYNCSTDHHSATLDQRQIDKNQSVLSLAGVLAILCYLSYTPEKCVCVFFYSVRERGKTTKTMVTAPKVDCLFESSRMADGWYEGKKGIFSSTCSSFFFLGLDWLLWTLLGAWMSGIITVVSDACRPSVLFRTTSLKK